MALITNLVSYWKLDEVSGNRADAHGANTLTDNNTVASATGIINLGGDFERANSESLSITDASQSGLDITGDISTSFWFKSENALASNEAGAFIWKQDGTDGAYAFVYQNAAGTNQLQAQFWDSGDPTNNVNYAKNQTLTDGVMYHIVFTFKASTGTCTIYLNGSSLGTVVNTAVDVINNSGATFFMGNDNSAARGVDGVMDEVGIWSKELTSAEVTSLYNGGLGLAYPFAVASATSLGSGFLSLLDVGN